MGLYKEFGDVNELTIQSHCWIIGTPTSTIFLVDSTTIWEKEKEGKNKNSILQSCKVIRV